MESQPDPEVFSRNTLTAEERCSKHEREMISFYCRTHQMLGCGTCIAMDHRNCLLGYIPDIIDTEDIAYELNSIETELDTVSNNIEEKTQQIMENIEQIDSAHNALVKELEQLQDDMISAVNESVRNARAEIDNLKDQDKENMKEATALSSEALLKLNEFKSKRERLQSDGKLCQLFIHMKKVKAEVLALYETIGALSKESEVQLGLKNCNLESERGIFPKILLQKKESASEKTNIPGKANRTPNLKPIHLAILVVAVTITMFVSLANQDHNDHVKQFDLDPKMLHLEVTNDHNICRYRRVMILSREILATSNYQDKIITFNMSVGQLMNIMKLTHSAYSYTTREFVRKNDTHLIAISEYGDVCYIDEIQIGQNVHNTQHYKGYCKGIAIVNENLAVLSSKSDIQEILIIDINWTFSRTIKINPIMAQLSHIHVSHDNLAFYLIEEKTESIVKLDFNGTLVASYQNIKFGSPRGLAIDSDGFVYVIGFDSQNIHRVTSDLKYVQIIPLNFKPISIAFGDALNRLYVGSERCGIYTIDIPE